MARQRSPNRDRAYELWIESEKKRALKDIAAEIGVSDTQVRKWKSQDDWENHSKGTLPKKSKSNVTKKKRSRGAQPGNKNAVGHGAPKGNKNNFKHGLYEEIYWDTLEEDEKQMIEAMRFDEEEDLLIEQIKLLTVRERRLLRRIEDQKNARGGLALESVVSRKLEIEGNLIKGKKQEQKETTTRTISTFEVVQRLETELTRVQARKTRCIEALNKLRVERIKMQEESKGNEIVNDWMAAVLIEEGESDE